MKCIMTIIMTYMTKIIIIIIMIIIINNINNQLDLSLSNVKSDDWSD